MVVCPLALTTPDTIVLVVCVVVAIRGAIKGFAWQSVRTLGLIAALWGATAWYEPVGGWLDERLPIPSSAVSAVAWVAIALGLFFLISYLAKMARGAVRVADLSGPDRILGLVLGAVMGLVLCTMAFVVWGSFQEDDELKATFKGSISVRYMAQTVGLVEPLIPGPIREHWGDVLHSLDDAVEDDTPPAKR